MTDQGRQYALMKLKAALGLTAMLFALLLVDTIIQVAFARNIQRQAIALPSKDGNISVERFAAPGTYCRSSVVILHVRQGIERLHAFCAGLDSAGDRSVVFDQRTDLALVFSATVAL
jgi:hypothetical protein